MVSRSSLLKELHELDARFEHSEERSLYEFIRAEILTGTLSYSAGESFGRKKIKWSDYFLLVTISFIQLFYFYLRHISKPLKYDIFLLEHPRRYSNGIVRFPKDNNLKTCEFIFSNLINPHYKNIFHTVSLDFVLAGAKVLSIIFSFLVTIEDKRLEDLCSKKILKRNKLYLILLEKFYSVFLRFLNPHELRIYVAYSKPGIALVKAAKTNGLRCVEYQHGNLNKFHPYYSFGYKINDPIYRCDELVTYELNYLKESGHIYSRAKQTYEEPIIKLPEFRDTQSIDWLIIGQSNIGLNKLLIQAALMAEVSFRFRPHPNDVTEYSKFCPSNVSANLSPNDDLNSAQRVIGINSTMLIQALNMGKDIYIINYPGYEYLESYINDVTLINICNETETRSLEILREYIC